MTKQPSPPEGDVLAWRYNMGSDAWYVRVRCVGWFYWAGTTWAPIPCGPPFAQYPYDFDDTVWDAAHKEEECGKHRRKP